MGETARPRGCTEPRGVVSTHENMGPDRGVPARPLNRIAVYTYLAVETEVEDCRMPNAQSTNSSPDRIRRPSPRPRSKSSSDCTQRFRKTASNFHGISLTLPGLTSNLLPFHGPCLLGAIVARCTTTGVPSDLCRFLRLFLGDFEV
jgi:hypothetical protein